MRRIESIEDELNQVVTYELDDGRREQFELRCPALFRGIEEEHAEKPPT